VKSPPAPPQRRLCQVPAAPVQTLYHTQPLWGGGKLDPYKGRSTRTEGPAANHATLRARVPRCPGETPPSFCTRRCRGVPGPCQELGVMEWPVERRSVARCILGRRAIPATIPARRRSDERRPPRFCPHRWENLLEIVWQLSFFRYKCGQSPIAQVCRGRPRDWPGPRGAGRRRPRRAWGARAPDARVWWGLASLASS
jgi:hypothetical protein